ncbi:putative ATP-binding component of multidrug ABC transporter [Wigglesworthia glossinidia endosymbiont of Glossina morsitans morsitans (Yale colony)]|uniref:Multidrug resistance-like ATP-binding protein MdlB n=1 Tax=Wigglesworthia glossinidia endosymbiont of Glossina morsitans morsitans (Yale colony) TaxID=1142511 RepID=H6Q598_WIGGL|nr:SmdB family multidrug efflux ABC transporter permease/ATP-binding protein [Wigglesworthia glossinidia]AFA41381.1 putative ATP-binding component of multidrug ABC transporter [Wigglesworthia glossinidia endosymbiont of Glossina morsitans morsitans (Yale colony)]
MCKKNYTLHPLKRLLRYAFPFRKKIFLICILLWTSSIMEISGPIIISYFIDCFFSEIQISSHIIVVLILTFISFQFLSAILRYHQMFLFSTISLSIVKTIRIEIMRTLLKQPLSWFDAQSTGKLISIVVNDTEVIKDLFTHFISSLLKNIALVGSMFIAILILNFKLGCILFFLFPILFYIMRLYQYYSIPIFRKLRTCVANINNFFNEVIQNMSIIQQFQQQKRFREKLYILGYEHFQVRMKNLKLEGFLLRPLLSLLFSLILCIILLFFGLNTSKIMGVGILYTFINYLGRLSEPLIELAAQQSILQQSIASGERIFYLLDCPIQRYGNDHRKILQGKVEVKNLTFSYHKNPILNQISFSIPEKSFLALVGKTGSGKTTLANLIMGHYPIQEGHILIDNRSIKTLSKYSMRNSIAMVQQEPCFMAKTIYDNIVLGRNISEKKVWSILSSLDLISFINSFPKGIFSKLDEYGNRLSMGQKQLLSFVRVLVSEPSILILDEATANIDADIEQKINYILYKIKNTTTLIVIAHRLSTILNADQILVLHHGKIIEKGTHQSLLRSKGKYYQMYYIQKYDKNFSYTY